MGRRWRISISRRSSLPVSRSKGAGSPAAQIEAARRRRVGQALCRLPTMPGRQTAARPEGTAIPARSDHFAVSTARSRMGGVALERRTRSLTQHASTSYAGAARIWGGCGSSRTTRRTCLVFPMSAASSPCPRDVHRPFSKLLLFSLNFAARAWVGQLLRSQSSSSRSSFKFRCSGTMQNRKRRRSVDEAHAASLSQR